MSKNAKKTRRVLYEHPPVEPVQAVAVSSANNTGRIREARHLVPAPTTNAAVDSPPVAWTPPIDSDQASEDVPAFHHAIPRPSAKCLSGIQIKRTEKPKRYKNSDAPLNTWVQFRDEYMDANIRLESRGPFWQKGCSLCSSPSPDFRCADCFGNRMVCRSCVMSKHADQPLHHIEYWNGTHFDQPSLQSLGLKYQLGHTFGDVCPFPKEGPKDFSVIHANGFHNVSITFCNCPGHAHPREQLLAVRWWPATPLEPQTAGTFDALRLFHAMNLQGKISAFDFYKSLELLTNADGLRKTPARLQSLMHLIRQWRHIKMGKRAGRGHSLAGISGTSDGELAIACRACPHPHINLPQGWEDAPVESSWLYQLITTEDANFRLSNRARSSDDKDPTLGPGWAYMVGNDAYLRHLAKFTDQDEISHCVGFAALAMANNKKSKGLRATGVGSVSCARHQMFRPTGTGDLQKGERYVNMDYIYMSSLRGIILLSLIASYDIACQWYKHFWERIPKLPKHLQFKRPPKIQFKVPKFHLPPHVPACHSLFSFNFTRWAGRTDGEGTERNWSWLNGAAPSTKEMGPGGRRDTLDDFCGYSNWKKTIGLGDLLLSRLIKAIPHALMHRQAFQAFTEGLQAEHSAEVAQWEQMVKDWEVDRSKPDPYSSPKDEITMEAVKSMLAAEEHSRVSLNGNTTDEMSPPSFVLTGMEIENVQQVLKSDVKKKSITTIQGTEFQTRRTTILKRVRRFRTEQAAYMPGLKTYLAGTSASDESDNSKPEELPLHLPSSIPEESRHLVCLPGLVEIERRLRLAQASESLEELRSHLRTRTFAAKFKVRNTTGQGPNTRAKIFQDSIESHIRACQVRYNTAREAHLKLAGHGDWEKSFQVLEKHHLLGLNERLQNEEEKAADARAREVAGMGPVDEDDTLVTVPAPFLSVGEGTQNRVLSWIWYSVSRSEQESDLAGNLHEGIRVEWAKQRARSERWIEEVYLLEEEMRRAVEFCHWRAKWWIEQATVRSKAGPIDPVLLEGLQAYAGEQAARENRLAWQWSAKWAPVRERARVAIAGLTEADGEAQLAGLGELEVEVELAEEEEEEEEVEEEETE